MSFVISLTPINTATHPSPTNSFSMHIDPSIMSRKEPQICVVIALERIQWKYQLFQNMREIFFKTIRRRKITESRLKCVCLSLLPCGGGGGGWVGGHTGSIL